MERKYVRKYAGNRSENQAQVKNTVSVAGSSRPSAWLAIRRSVTLPAPSTTTVYGASDIVCAKNPVPNHTPAGPLIVIVTCVSPTELSHNAPPPCSEHAIGVQSPVSTRSACARLVERVPQRVRGLYRATHAPKRPPYTETSISEAAVPVSSVTPAPPAVVVRAQHRGVSAKQHAAHMATPPP